MCCSVAQVKQNTNYVLEATQWCKRYYEYYRMNVLSITKLQYFI